MRSHFAADSPHHPSVVHLLSTSTLYDAEYDAKIKEPTVIVASDDESPFAANRMDAVRVEGEALVDSIGRVVDSYWKVLKPRKGKGTLVPQLALWENFCGWLEQSIEFHESEEDLVSSLACGDAPAFHDLSQLTLPF